MTDFHGDEATSEKRLGHFLVLSIENKRERAVLSHYHEEVQTNPPKN